MNASNSSGILRTKKEAFTLNYNPEANKNIVIARRIARNNPENSN